MYTLTILGMGAFPGHLTEEAQRALRDGAKVVLQTARCYLAQSLSLQGIRYRTMDGLYEQAEDFDELNETVARNLVLEAQGSDVVYALLGGAEGKAVCAAIAKAAAGAGIELRVLPGVSYGACAAAAAGGRFCYERPARMLFAADLEGAALLPGEPLVVQELDNVMLAGDAKLLLSEYYPDELEILLATAEYGQYQVRALPLCELDRQERSAYAHTTCVLLPPLSFGELERRGPGELQTLIARLRAPDGCPWDREQTPGSLLSSLLEETYEVAEAIELEDDAKLCEELGDLMMLVVMLSCIAQEHGSFTLRDVTSDVCAKLVHRHPHVFGGGTARDTGAVLRSWEALKMEEKGESTLSQSMRDVAKPLPALMRAEKIQKKAGQVGFDWKDPLDALEKVREETEELEEELRRREGGAQNGARVEEELGDLLFAAANVARLAKVKSELALGRATEKFVRRFERMEAAARADGRGLADMTLEEMDALWDKRKNLEN